MVSSSYARGLLCWCGAAKPKEGAEGEIGRALLEARGMTHMGFNAMIELEVVEEAPDDAEYPWKELGDLDPSLFQKPGWLSRMRTANQLVGRCCLTPG
jgi:hypothetical protein